MQVLQGEARRQPPRGAPPSARATKVTACWPRHFAGSARTAVVCLRSASSGREDSALEPTLHGVGVPG